MHHDAVGGYSHRPPTPFAVLSPELALVDPDLAELRKSSAPEQRVVVPQPAASRGRSRWLQLASAAVAITIGLGVGLVIAQLRSSPAPTPRTSTDVTPAAAPLLRTVRPPVRLRWQGSRTASYFDFVLWRDGHRILDLWPKTARVAVPASWSYRDKRYKLVPGRYSWFVYPGVGARSAGRFGRMAGEGQFRVAR